MSGSNFIRSCWPAWEELFGSAPVQARPGAGVAGDEDAPYEISLSIRNYDVDDTPLGDVRVEALDGSGAVLAGGWTDAEGNITLRINTDRPTTVRVLARQATSKA